MQPLKMKWIWPQPLIAALVWIAPFTGAAAEPSSMAELPANAGQPSPEIRVVKESSALNEEAPVGPYQQPEWTTQRRFATTRVYLQQQPGEVGVEQWVKTQWPKGDKSNCQFQEEVEIGLPHRFQLDIYENWDVGPVDANQYVPHGAVMQDGISTELRYALADWGKIPLNPTLYGEWTFRNHAIGADRYEVKLLLGEQIAPRWHWGCNVVFEQEIGQVRTREYSASTAFSYTLIDRKLSVGVEAKIENEAPADDTHIPIEVDVGPSIQWRPTPNSHIDIVPLFGATSDSPRLELWIVAGIDFGPGGERKQPLAPISTRSQ